MSIYQIKLTKLFFGLTLALSIMLFGASVFAMSKHVAIVDVFGTNKFIGEELQKRYGIEFEALANAFQSFNIMTEKSVPPEVEKIYTKIFTELSAKEKFAFLDIGPTIYPGNPNVYFTIDVVEKRDSYRLKDFLPKPTKSFADPGGLIAAWNDYLKTGWEVFPISKKVDGLVKCPVAHCIFGFDKPRLKKYKAIFMQGAIKYKTQLKEILREDKDEEKRTNAAYLLGNLTDRDEVINIISPYMRDSSSRVRNSVMRVLGEALKDNVHADFPIDTVITALNDPDAVDRNKAIFILSSLSIQPRYAVYIKENASKQLMVQLKMLQPNVHDIAYKILKQISGKNYGERDYAAWQNWLDSKSL